LKDFLTVYDDVDSISICILRDAKSKTGRLAEEIKRNACPPCQVLAGREREYATAT